MHKLITACLSQPRAMIMVFILLLYIGVQSFIAIPKEAEPDVQIPIIYVSMSHEGISPADAERLLVKPMEKELKSIEGVKEMTATASQGHASVVLEFDAGFDSDTALNDVREKVDVAKSELPEDTREPTVNEVNLSLFPVINVILTGSLPEPAMVKIAKNLRDKIEEIPDVLEVNISGDREEVVNILVDPVTLENYGLTSEVIQNVTRNNLLVAAGTLSADEGRFTVKVPSLLEDLDDIYSLPLKVSGESVVTIADVARLQKYFKDPTTIARVNGQPAIVLEVSKRTGSNIIGVTDAVRAAVKAEQRYFPAGLEVLYSGDKSNNIRNNLVELQNNLIIAIFLVLVVVILFSGLEAGIFVAVSVPGAFLIGVLVLDSLSLTMNIVVLFALILSIGMLVDAAIVVVECANRKMLDGADHKTAYREAALRMAWPLFASTLTTLIVFAPLLFWPGIVGQFMKYLPLTLIATLSGSFIMAILFLPTFASLLKKKQTDDDTRHEIELIETGDIAKLKGFYGSYARLLLRLVQRPLLVVAGIVIALVLTVFGYSVLGNGTEFFPDIEPENGQVLIQARGNLSVYEQDAIVKRVEAALKGLEGVRVFYTRVGSDEGGNRDLPEDTVGVIQLEFSDWQKRPKAAVVLEEVMQRTADLPGVVIEARKEQAGPAAQKPIDIEISSRYPEVIKPVAEQIMELLKNTEHVLDIESNLPVPGIEWKMDIDRSQALRFGVDMAVLGNFVRLVTNGLKVTSYRPDDSDDEVDVMLRFPKEYRHLGTLDTLKAITPNGAIPVSNFMKRIAQPKEGVLHRSDSMRAVSVKASVEQGQNANAIIAALSEKLPELVQDPNIRIRFKGDQEQQKETQDFLGSAFMLALIAMFLVLLIQFNSFYRAGIIISAVFLAIIGVLIGLIITGQAFGIVMCGVGVIALGGVVVNNNIILIDTYRIIREELQEPPKQAAARAAVQRLKSVLLTAGTTVLGLIPMVLAMNINVVERYITFGAPSTQWWQQLSTAIAGGLSFATILTLFLTPCLLSFERDGRKKVKDV